MLFDQQEVLEHKRDSFLEDRPGRGIISLDYPLISNLNVWENIALIRQYHEMWPREKAREDAIDSLRLLGMERIAPVRNADLREEERFAAMLARACKLPDAEILLDRPFEIVPTVHDFSFFDAMLKKLTPFYEACYIFDYRWNQHDYGAEYAEEY